MAVKQVREPALEKRELVDALLAATRALVAIAIRSLDAWPGEVTLAQFRVLALLCSEGPQGVADLAGLLGVAAPNATRICARLSDKGLVRRSRIPVDRRSVRVSATAAGRDVVARVNSARRAELEQILAQVPADVTAQVVEALDVFTAAAVRGAPDGAGGRAGSPLNGGLTDITSSVGSPWT